jgi:hypothetical protein
LPNGALDWEMPHPPREGIEEVTTPTCTTHHFACACREKEFRDLLEDVMRDHSDPTTCFYNECEKSPCEWCVKAKRLLKIETAPGGVSE